MQPDAVLIQQPAIDFATFLGLSAKALGYSPSAAVDASHRELTDAERFLSCLAAFREREAPIGFSPHLLHHVSFSMFIAADECDMTNILEASGGMPFVVAETVARGIQVIVMTGTLSQWRDAVKSGLAANADQVVRACYTKIMSQFDRSGLSAVWSDSQRKTGPGGYFLEDKRK